MGTRHFKSKGAYLKWNAYGHMRTKSGKRAKSKKQSVFGSTPGHQKVYIGGKRYYPKH